MTSIGSTNYDSLVTSRAGPSESISEVRNIEKQIASLGDSSLASQTIKKKLAPQLLQQERTLDSLNNPNSDFFYYRNDQIFDSLSILRNADSNKHEIKYPNVLSHEIIKSQYQPLFKTNEFSVLPDVIHRLKREYINDIHNPNANRFFLSTGLQKSHRETYYNNLKNNNLVVNKLYNDVFNVLNKRVFYSKKYNFGNKVSGFYLNNTSSSVLGKLANIVLDNSDINFSNNHGDTKFFNNSVEEIQIKNTDIDFEYFNDEEKKKIFSILFSSYTDENKLYKDCNENNFIVNSDKLINQNLLNTAVSLNGIYKDSLYNLQNFENSFNNSKVFKESLKIIDSEVFDALPIIKIESIINKIDSNDFLNPYSYDNINNINHRHFNIQSLNPDSYMKKDQKNRISSVNQEVGNIFGKSLFLSNSLSKYIRFIDSTASYIDDEYNVKQDNIPLIEDSDKEPYANYFFNHSLVPEIRVLNDTLEELTYMTDIRLFDNSSLQYHSGTILENDSNNRAFKILNNAKFIYNFKRISEDFSNNFPLKKINAIVTENVRDFRNADTAFSSTRFPLPTFQIPFNQWAFRKYTKDLEQNILKFRVYDNNTIVSDQINNLDASDGNLVTGQWSLNLNKTLNYYVKERIYRDYNDSDSQRGNIHGKIKSLIRPDAVVIGKENNNYEFDNATGFVLFRNSMNNVSIDELHKKFVLYDDAFTDDSEFSSSRVVLSSSKSDIEENNYVETSIDDIKKVSFEDYGYSWQKISLDLSNNMFELKKKSLENSNTTDFLKYMLEYKAKVKSAKQSNSDFTLVYSDVDSVSIDKKASSDFLSELDEDLFVQKFNFSEPHGNVKNSISAINNQIIDEIDLEVNAGSVKEYASLIYKNSIFKSEKVYYDYIKNQISSVIQDINNDYNSSAYDKLLSDTIINNDNDFVFEILASSAMLDYKGLSNETTNFTNVNNATEGSFELFLNEIYSVENIKRQKSYNLRTYKYPKGNISKKFNRGPGNWSASEPEKNTAKFSYSNTDFACWDVSDHVLDCGVLPGSTFNLCFPFLTTKYDYKSNKEKDFHCSIYKSPADDYLLVDKKKFDQAGNNDVNSDLADLYEFFFSSFYNNDVYLNTSKEKSIVWENIKNYGPRCEIKSLIKDNTWKNNDTRVNFKEAIENLTFSQLEANFGNIDPFQDLSDLTNPIERDHSYGYRSISNNILDYTFSSRESRLKNTINRIIMDCFFQFSKDFDVEIASLNSIESIYSFVKDNKTMSKNILGLLRPLCLMYTIYFDSIVDLSVRKFLYEALSNNDPYQDFFGLNKKQAMWNSDVADLILKPDEIGYISGDLNKYAFGKEVAAEDMGAASELLYLKFHSEIGLIDKTLNNTAVLNIMSLDTIFSYFTEFERFKIEASIEADVVSRRLEEISEKVNVEDPNELLSNKSRVNLIAKNLNDYYYYQTIEYDKYYGLSRNINTNLKEKFDHIINNDTEKMYSTHLKRDKSLAELAKQSTVLINGSYQQYDIIRFGISLEMAELLRNRSILKFKITLLNHKFPNINIPAIYKFYTPVFTEVMPSHFDLMTNTTRLVDSSYSKNVVDNLGFYDYNEDSLKDRYSVLSKNEGIAYSSLELINNVNNERMFNSESILIDNTPENKVLISKSIVESAIISNLIKYMSYINQKEFNENNIRSLNIDGLDELSNVASGFLGNLSKESFEQIFLESYDDLIETLNEEEEIDYESLFEKKVYSLDFLKKTSDYIDSTKIEDIFSDKKFYDIFSILISRKDIKDLLTRDRDRDDVILRSIENENFFDSFSYVIQAEIV